MDRESEVVSLSFNEVHMVPILTCLVRVSEIIYRINSITLVTTTEMREQKVIILELWSFLAL
jgi:hypothetical protein